MVEKFIYNVEKNILNFSLNKCVADIYTVFNYLEKEKIYLYDHELSKKILCCLFPIVPNLSKTVNEKLFKSKKITNWPIVNMELLEVKNIKLPIQIQGKLVTTIDTQKGYLESEILNSIYELDRVKNKIINKKVVKVINVQDKIINIIVN